MEAKDTSKKILFVSLGCDKNRVDSERMLGMLAKDAYSLTDGEEDADIIIVNTCCFIDEAKEESVRTVLDMAAFRREGKCRVLIVAGCMSERYRQEILDEIPEVDAIVGTHSYAKIRDAIIAAERGERPSYLEAPAALTENEPDRVLTTGGFFAYLKIAEGCDRHCTYCVIPSLRGPYRSVPREALVKEASALAGQGVRELILVAQDTACYGKDLYGEKKLHELLTELCRIEGISWIRILYCYPEEIYPELIEVMKRETKICHYLDMPIQHSENAVLRRMGRRTTREGLLQTIASLRESIPDIVLRTTLITGFPGETEEQHRALCDFVKEVRFERLGVFTYSREEGTPAYRMHGQISQDVKEARREELLQCQQDVSREAGEAVIGRIAEVFIEGFAPEEGVWVGRTRGDAPDVDGLIFVRSHEELHSGDIVPVRITAAREYDLIGEYEDECTEEYESAE